MQEGVKDLSKVRDTRANSSIFNQVLVSNASHLCHNVLICTFNHN